VQEGPFFRVRDEGFGVYALLSRVRGVVASWSDFPLTWEVCSGDYEAIWNAKLQAYVYTHGNQPEED
jgi:hypothetical protein